MKVKRLKRAQRVLTYFKYQHQVNPPYRILVDGTFCKAALDNQLNIREQMPKYLGAETQLATTKCVLHELESLGPALYGALRVCQNFEIDECVHSSPLSASTCITHCVKRAANNKQRYFVATQDDTLKQLMRDLKHVPILFIDFKTILFDKVQDMSEKIDHKAELERVRELRKEILGESEQKLKKKKKVKGANPLSCKKKIVKAARPNTLAGSEAVGTASGKRRRRKKLAPGSGSHENLQGKENDN